MKARLYVRNPLDLGLVAEVEIPPFKVLPEALLWGSRFFHLANPLGFGAEALAARTGVPIAPDYIEGLVIPVAPVAQTDEHRERDAEREWVKSSLRAMVYCVEHLNNEPHCNCRLRACNLYEDDGPIFKAANEGIDAISFLVTSLAIASGALDEDSVDPEFVANLQKMDPDWVEGMIENAIGGLKALLRGTKWEKPE